MLFSKIPLNVVLFDNSERKTKLSPLTVDIHNVKYVAHLTDGKTIAASNAVLLQAIMPTRLLPAD